ncbi:unnamed protein product, partial [Heterotrigona itama]
MNVERLPIYFDNSLSNEDTECSSDEHFSQKVQLQGISMLLPRVLGHVVCCEQSFAQKCS